jgi:[ribosomal protein S5]-alanine N-acetyltransferase
MTARVRIRAPVLADMPEFLRAVRASRALHRPWVTAPATPEEFRASLQRMVPPGNYAFLVCHDGAIAGVVNLTNIVRGVFKSGYLGYYAFAGHERQGVMRQGLALVVRHAFKVLKLHRLEANIQPANTPSIALVKACGFRLEGHSPSYLKIGGRWRDHERWAIVATDARSAPSKASRRS